MKLINYKKIVIFILASFIATVAILFLLQNWIILPFIKDKCESAISELMDYSVSIGKIEGGLYQGINLIDIISDDDVLKCDNITAKIDFSNFIMMNFVFESLSFNRLSINHYEIYPLLEKLFYNSEPSSYRIDYININNSDIIYNNNKINLNFSIRSSFEGYSVAIDSIRYVDSRNKLIYDFPRTDIIIDSNNDISSESINIFDVNNNKYEIKKLKFNFEKSNLDFKFFHPKSVLAVQSKFKVLDKQIEFSNILIQDLKGHIKIDGNIKYFVDTGDYKGNFNFNSLFLDDYNLEELNISFTGDNKFSYINLLYNDFGFRADEFLEIDGNFKYSHTSENFIFDTPFTLKSEKYFADIEILDFTSFSNNKVSISASFDNIDLLKMNSNFNSIFNDKSAVISGGLNAVIHNNNNALYYTGKLDLENIDINDLNINNTLCEFAYSEKEIYDFSCDFSEVYYLKKMLYDSINLTFNSELGIHIDSQSKDNHINANVSLFDQKFNVDVFDLKLFGIEYHIKPNQISVKNFMDYEIKDLHIYINESELILDGNYNSEITDMHLVMKNLNLNNLFSKNVKGFINGEVSYSSTQISSLLYGDFSIDTLRTNFFNTDNIKVKIAGKNGLYEIINMSSIYNGNESFVDGKFKLEDINKFPQILSNAEDLNLNLAINNLEIDYLSKYYYPNDNLEGLASFNGVVSGSTVNPSIIGNLVIKNLDYKHQKISSLDAKLIINNNGIDIDDMNIIADRNNINIDGYIPFLIDADNYDLKLRGKLNNIKLSDYISHADSINGEINFEVDIRGDYLNPIKDGKIEIKNSTVYLKQIDNPVLDLNTNADIKNNTILISNAICSLPNTKKSKGLFLGSKGSKSKSDNINISGSINIDDIYKPDFDISFKGQNIYIESTYNQIQGLVDANLNIIGRDSIAISGIVRPVDNSFIIYELLSPISESYEEISDEYSVSYDIHFPMDETIKVNTNDINLILDGDVDIIKSFSDNSYQLIGRVNVIDGRFNFNGNNFKETNGYILFNPNEDTYIDIKSIATVIDEEINVSFIGNLNNPTIILDSSSGTYSHSDILKMLAFKNSDDNNQDISSFLTNYIKNELEKNIVRYSNLDEFQVVSGNSISSNVNNVNISMGKQLSDNLYMNLTYDVNNNNLSNYELSYRVNKNVSIVGGGKNDESWHLKYRFKYQY